MLVLQNCTRLSIEKNNCNGSRRENRQTGRLSLDFHVLKDPSPNETNRLSHSRDHDEIRALEVVLKASSVENRVNHWWAATAQWIERYRGRFVPIALGTKSECSIGGEYGRTLSKDQRVVMMSTIETGAFNQSSCQRGSKIEVLRPQRSDTWSFLSSNLAQIPPFQREQEICLQGNHFNRDRGLKLPHEGLLPLMRSINDLIQLLRPPAKVWHMFFLSSFHEKCNWANSIQFRFIRL